MPRRVLMDVTVAPRRHALTTDWRAEVCNFLGESIGAEEDVLFKGLDKITEDLRELEQLRRLAASASVERPPRFQIINLVKCHSSSTGHQGFLDTPTLVKSGPNRAHWRCYEDVGSIEHYLERNKEVLFLVQRHYECCKKSSQAGSGPSQHESGHHDAQDLMTGEHISITSPKLANELSALSDIALSDIPHPDFCADDETIRYPYLWWFHRRVHIEDAIASMNPRSREHLDIFKQYLEDRIGSEWDSVADHFSRSVILPEFLKYLFVKSILYAPRALSLTLTEVPGDIILSCPDKRDPTLLKGSVLHDWIPIEMVRTKTQGLNVTLKLRATYWSFGGTFESHTSNTDVSFSLEDGVTSIADLPVYPKRFADASSVDALRSRGKMLWRCRHRHYVVSKSESDRTHDSINHRFMVDMQTYNELHPPKTTNFRDTSGKKLDSELMLLDDPGLGDSFLLCLPTSVSGFNMHKHEWVTLQVGDLDEVTWNEDAFSHLVLESGTKELVQAVITEKLQEEEHMDFIQGKGNGLFILLHGGPGTGKTLTAESVAEIAKRPLYKVSCGDIGTTVDKVEEYFATVFELCKIWECVVLLDEADVFLEQRSLQQLERNALVSVFLRVLEYYNGILILTTNRIGTFDEAFKSRMHLTIRYEGLKLFQRRQIWTKFVDRLAKLEESGRAISTSNSSHGFRGSVDVSDIQKYLEVLAEIPLNGRQIRNVISTAKQLAKYKDESMRYEHLSRVISEVVKFESYIQEVHDDHTSDEIARERETR